MLKTVLAGRYELGEELGSGGMARVVAAHDLELDRPVAVKLLRLEADRSARARFLREARTAARFQHSDAVTVHDAGEHDGRPYIVMELVRGVTLADRLARSGPVPVTEAVEVTARLLGVLAAAHARGLVHRDVKPTNVLLPDDGGVKLADFGIAKALDDATSGLTSPGTVVGTVGYVAPELVEGRAASPASDVYAVGCLLFELLTGRPPYLHESPLSVAYAHVREPVPDVREHRPDVPPGLAAVIERALDKDPAARFRDAGELRTALLEAPGATPPPTVPLPGVGSVAGDAATRAMTVAQPGEGRPGRADEELASRRTSTERRPGTLVLVALVALLLALAALGTRAVLSGGSGAADDTEPTEAPIGDVPTEPEPDPGPGGGEAVEEPGGNQAAQVPDEAVEEPGGAVEEPGGAETTELAQLVLVLTEAPSDTFGKRHDDLLEDLVELSRESAPEKQAEEAHELREEVADWVAKGELDPAIGEMADVVLGRIAAR